VKTARQKSPALASAKRITAAPPGEELAELSTIELGRRHLAGTGKAAQAARSNGQPHSAPVASADVAPGDTAQSTPAGIAATVPGAQPSGLVYAVRAFKVGDIVRTNYDSGPYRIVSIKEGCTCASYLDSINGKKGAKREPHMHFGVCDLDEPKAKAPTGSLNDYVYRGSECVSVDGPDAQGVLDKIMLVTPVEEAARKNGKPAKKTKAPVWPSGLSELGHPTYICPVCQEPHGQTVCPSTCKNCGTAGDPAQSDRPTAKLLSGEDPVFKLYTLADLEARRETKPAKRETTPAAGETADQAGLQVFLDIPLDKIVPSPDNPRKTFPQAELEELASSIDQIGLQDPLVVLPASSKNVHELVDGERRFKALQILAKRDKGKWRIVRCEVRALSPQAARDYRLATFVRQGLNPIDQARAFEEATAGGMTQAALGKLVGVTQGAVANKIRLLKAPKTLQQRVITGEMSERDLRELLTWGEIPNVLEKLGAKLWGKKLDNHNVAWEARQIAFEMSRPMHQNTWSSDFRKFKTTPALEKELDVRKVGNEKRAFNVARYDELQKAADSKASKLKDAAAGSKQKTETPAERKAKAKKQQDIFDRRLYLYKLRWLQQRCADRLLAPERSSEGLLLKLLLHFTTRHSYSNREEELCDTINGFGGRNLKNDHRTDLLRSMQTLADEKLWPTIRAVLAKWIQHDADSWHGDFHSPEIEALAKELKVSIEKEWRLDRTFLELHSKDQLCALLEDWGIGCTGLDGGQKRSELIAVIENANPKKCPRELLDLKPMKVGVR